VRVADSESSHTHLEGFVIKEYTPSVQSPGRTELDWYLKRKNVVSIQGVDTRAIVRRLRSKGSMRGVISSIDLDHERLHRKVLDTDSIRELSLVDGCSCKSPYQWNGSDGTEPEGALCAVVYDFGAKRGILNSVSRLGIRVTVVPHDLPAEHVLKMQPHGVLFSNGPGDPEMVKHAIKSARILMGRLPLFGICLGHQILCLAMGASTYKLRFGHHGGNHPVKDLATGEIKITCQNHNYAADKKSIEDCGGKVTHMNLYDGTVEGMVNDELNLFGIQYHPEACPGPNDSRYLFERFVSSMRAHAKA
jgi:carbamoyl-phosphate synthase small subunit